MIMNLILDANGQYEFPEWDVWAQTSHALITFSAQPLRAKHAEITNETQI